YLEPLGDVALVSGGQYDGVGRDAAAVDELGAAAEEPPDPGHDLDVAGADPGERADVEHGRPPPGVLELEGPPGWPGDADLGEVAEEEPCQDDQDPVHHPQRQEP
ncbi:Os07g0437250, partial [Oryza sativa Japonica Group]